MTSRLIPFVALAGLALAVGCANAPSAPKAEKKGSETAAAKADPKPAAATETKPAAPAPTEAKPAAGGDVIPAGASVAVKEGGWGTVKGTVTFGGDKVPEKVVLNVDKDQDHCLQNGPVTENYWEVNAQNKGLKGVVVFLRPERGKKIPVHASLEKSAAKQVVLDQPFCHFVPRVVVMRDDQELLAKNPAPKAHNVQITGLQNDENFQMAPGTERAVKVKAERNPISLKCGAHPWMQGSLWVFDHPYFVQTDADGKFEIKNAPSGTHTLMIWHDGFGGYLSREGLKVTIPENGVAEIPATAIKPKE